jgi:hypothetical protein
VNNLAFEQRARKGKQDFIRERKTTFKELIYFMLGYCKGKLSKRTLTFFPTRWESGYPHEPASLQCGLAKDQRNYFRPVWPDHTTRNGSGGAYSATERGKQSGVY